MPAARALARQVLEAPVDSLGRGELAALSLVAGLAAGLSRGGLEVLAGHGAALGTGPRRILGGRRRAVLGAAPELAAELLDLGAKRSHLLDQLRGELSRRLPASESDRLGVLAPHTREIPFTGEESSSRRRRGVNAYRCARDRSRRCDPQVETALARRSREPEAHRFGLIDRAHRPFQSLEEPNHHRARRAAQALQAPLAAPWIEDRRNRLRLMHVEPYQRHTLRHGRHLP